MLCSLLASRLRHGCLFPAPRVPARRTGLPGHAKGSGPFASCLWSYSALLLCITFLTSGYTYWAMVCLSHQDWSSLGSSLFLVIGTHQGLR